MTLPDEYKVRHVMRTPVFSQRHPEVQSVGGLSPPSSLLNKVSSIILPLYLEA